VAKLSAAAPRRSLGLATMSRKSLAADIDDLLNVAPRDYDPEDEPGYDAVTTSYDHDDDEHDAPVDVPDGRLRLKGGLHDSFDPEDPSSAYAGRRASRRDLDSSDDDEQDDDGEEEENEDDEDEEEDEGDDSSGSGDDDDDDDGSDDDSESDEDDQGEDEDAADDDDEEEMESAPALLSSSFAKTRRRDSNAEDEEPDDVTKGTHIATQKRLWDSLLQLRMRLQPTMESARQLPRPPAQELLRSAADDAAATATSGKKSSKKRAAAEQVSQRLGGAVAGLESVESELCGLLGDLGELQQALASNNSEVAESVAKRRKISKPPPPPSAAAGDGESDEEGDSDEEDGDEEKEKEEEQTDGGRSDWDYSEWEGSLLEPYLLGTIDRWGRRVQNKAMGLGIGKGVAFKSLNKPVSAQVDELLQSSRERLLQRTRLKRTQYRVLGQDGGGKGRKADGSERRDEAALEEAAELGLQPSTHEYDEHVYVS